VHDIGVVPDGCGVDHAETKTPHSCTVQTIGPVGEIPREAEDVPGVTHCRRGGRPDASSSAVSLEQRYAETALEFGKSLRQCRGTDPDLARRKRP
jgi:hypothetical protein